MSYICRTKVVVMKKYKSNIHVDNKLNEPEVNYFINYTHTGMAYQAFEKQSSKVPFTQNEWSFVLNLSERTFQRYKKDEA